MTPSFARQALASSVAWLCATIAPFVVAGAVFRSAGEDAYGTWATVLALRAFLLMLDGGLTFGTSRDAALLETEGRAAWARIRASFRVHAGIAAGAVVLGILVAALPGTLLGAGGGDAAAARLVTVLAFAEGAAASLGTPLFGILRGKQRFEALAAATAAQALLGIVLVLLVLPAHGLAGAAAALLAARVAVLGGVCAWMRARGLLNRPDGPGDARPDLRAMVAFALPLWVTTFGAWLGLIADVPLVAALFGVEAAGHYDLGYRFAAACSGLLFAVLAVAFPRFVTAQGQRRREGFGAAVFLGCTLGACGFGLVVGCADTILRLWVGTAPPLAVTVLSLYALVWLVNVPAHVLSSVMIATSQHRLLATVTALTVPVNVGISVALALGGLPHGPAVGTLIAIVGSNWLLLPLLALRRVDLRWSDWVRPAALGYGSGAAIAGVTALLVSSIGAGPGSPDVVALGAGIACTLLLCAVLLDLTVRARSTLRLLWLRARRGGFAVLARQRRQCREVKKRLAAAPRPRGSLADRPLVTVRIATYNRGRLVAERALASAIAQTYENLEIVVVGDCCDEATAAAVRSVDDPRIRFVNLAERGRYPSDPELRWMVAGSTPMNHGVEIARGEWIAPLDDDDEFSPDHVETLLRECLERGLDFAWGVAECEQSDGTWKRLGSWPLRPGHVCHTAVLYSRRVADLRHDLDAWRLDEPGDWNLWSRFRRAGAVMGFVDRVVCRHYAERRGLAARRPLWLPPAPADAVPAPRREPVGAGAGSD